MQFKATALSSAAIEVLGQLFASGPTSDGNVASKLGRGELVAAELAFHAHGWASLTAEGVRVASEWDRKALALRHDQRWIKKIRES
jgi:hypothetical protein